MVGDFGWEHEGTECQVDTVKGSRPLVRPLEWGTCMMFYIREHQNYHKSKWKVPKKSVFIK